MLFELLHNFQILKSFITPDFNQTNSLGNFSSHQSIFLVLKLNIQTIFVFLDRQFILPSILTIISIITFSVITFKKSQLFIIFHLLCSLVLFIVLLPKTAEFHYSLPFGLLILFLFAFVIARSSLYLLLSLIIILEIFFFPFDLFKPSARNFVTIEKRVNFILAQNIIDKEPSLNVIRFSDSNSFLPIGQEYRFFLRRAGYKVDSEYEYPKSKQLVIFAEYPQFDITKFRTWETSQFGNDYLRNYKQYTLEETSIYVVKKF